MRRPFNFDKHPYLPRTYIVYDKTGLAFRVRRTGSKGWEAFAHYSSAADDKRWFTGATLEQVARAVSQSAPN
jgi:hypothetical protein